MNLHRNIFFLLLLLFVNSLSSSAQEFNKCGTMNYVKNQKVRLSPTTTKSNSQSLPLIITIPVVVHVVHNTPLQNINTAQILSQLQVLNEDFRRLNADAANTPTSFLPIAADVEIEFCLANVDPNGFQTTGITRTATPVTSFGVNDDIKTTVLGGQDAWNTANYLNMWVGPVGGGVLGFAQFPGMNPATDGIVIDYRSFGTTGTATLPYHLGRTATHEVGHWLGLRHIWGDGGCGVDDGIADTPLAGNPNFVGAPCTATPNSCIEASGDQPDMFQNFMDFSEDACMNLFTMGQKNQMRAVLEEGGLRSSLLSSNGCANNGILFTCSDGFKNGEELGIDCGGSICIDCATLCADGIQNGNELGVDCGGSCPTCPPDPTEVCTTATLLLVDGTYTASGPSMGMGATQLLADHANWYYFIPPSNGILSINSCGSGVDTRIWVYEGCCNNLISVDASDDDCELFPGGPTWASEINNLPVSQGIVYYFEWDDRWSSNSFDFDFSFTPINGGPIRTPITCPDCPDDLRNITAPAIVVQSESSCTDGNLTGGMLVAPSPSCPATATLFYSIDGGVIFSSDIPAYDQINPMSIHTKCVCDSDPTVFGNSTLILTNPGQCIAEMITSIPTLSQWGKGIFGLLILNLGLLILRWKEDGRGLIVRL